MILDLKAAQVQLVLLDKQDLKVPLDQLEIKAQQVQMASLELLDFKVALVLQV